MRYIITIDQRTSSSKALLFDQKLNLLDHKIIPHKINHPRQDWVEADPEEIYVNTVAAIKQLDLPEESDAIYSVSIVNQRETVVVWDKRTGKPVYPAIMWQCRRGAAFPHSPARRRPRRGSKPRRWDACASRCRRYHKNRTGRPNSSCAAGGR